MAPSAHQRPGLASVSIRPGAAVLSVLKHLNYRAWFALAEFVDNAVQSAEQNRAALAALHSAAWRPKVKITIESTPPTLIRIWDNAAGISAADFPREPRRVCRRLQPLRGWSDDGEEDGGELLA